MPRYYFHVMDRKAVIDEVGVELPDLDGARTEAIRSAGQMLSTGRETWTGDAWRMTVVDEAGVIVFGVSFAVDHYGF